MCIRSFLLGIFCICIFTGCETAHKATYKGGEYLGKGANVVGGVAEGGASAVKGPETSEENPYGR